MDSMTTKELIKIETREGKETVNARDLHEFLEVGRDFTNWIKDRIEKYGFVDNLDYLLTKIGEQLPSGMKYRNDYHISIDMAKELSMVENNEKGRIARKYFIECEKKSKNTPQIPKNYAEALRLAADQSEQIESMKIEAENNKPKIEFFNAVADSKDAIQIGDAAKVLNMGIGRNNLFDLLRNKKILMENNTPYQTYIDQGYFRVIETKFTTHEGETKISFKTLVYQKGLDFIRKLLQKANSLQLQ